MEKAPSVTHRVASKPALSSATLAADQRIQASLEVREPLERQLEPLGRGAIARLCLGHGERVLDIGCGIGGSPLALSRAIGQGGEVVGIDVMQAAVDIAQADRNRPQNVSFICGDVETFPFAEASFDAAFSRFGVMFFSDPVTAFANVRRALRPDGRLSFVCWRGLAENELDGLPLRAASPYVPTALVAEAVSASHFSFADPAYLRAALEEAGYTQIDIGPHDEDVRSGNLEAMMAVCSRFGSLGKILREHPELRHRTIPVVRRALRRLDGPGGPALRAATWLVVARVPA